MPPKEVKKSKQKTISDILQMYNLKNNKTEFCKEKNFNEIKDAYKKSPMYKTEYETKYYPKNGIHLKLIYLPFLNIVYNIFEHLSCNIYMIKFIYFSFKYFFYS